MEPPKKKTKTNSREVDPIFVPSTSSSGGWACLPVELVDLILKKLMPISDYIRFGAVCKHWQSVSADQKEYRVNLYRKQLPVLLSIRRGGIDADIYSITDGKIGTLELPHGTTSFCGSSHGWLACANDLMVVTLFNPFIGRTILLPPVLKFPKSTIDYSLRFMVLSADPSLFPHDYEAIIIYNRGHSAFAKNAKHFKSADDTWTRIDIPNGAQISSLNYHRGQFLAVDWTGRVYLLDVNSHPNVSILVGKRRDENSPGLFRYHLVESSRGDLLLLEETSTPFAKFRESFKVFKLSRSCAPPFQWVVTTAIEGMQSDVFFIDSRSASMSLSALEFPGCHCQPNSIYFFHPSGKVGVFKSENGQVEWPYSSPNGPEDNHKSISIWIAPTMV